MIISADIDSIKLNCDRGDVVEIDTWVDAAGKNGMRRDWIIRDYNTREIITRATRLINQRHLHVTIMSLKVISYCCVLDFHLIISMQHMGDHE